LTKQPISEGGEPIHREDDAVRVTEDVFINSPGQGRQKVVVFDAREMVVLLFEAQMGATRPAGSSVEDAYHALADNCDEDHFMSLQRQAHAMQGYCVGQLQGAVEEGLLQ
jgi:hypothetical protein